MGQWGGGKRWHDDDDRGQGAARTGREDYRGANAADPSDPNGMWTGGRDDNSGRYRDGDPGYAAGQGGDAERDNRGHREDRYLGQGRERVMSSVGQWGGPGQGGGRMGPGAPQGWNGPAGPSRGEHAGRGPKGYQRSDARILEEVNEHLTRDGHVDATHIEVVCQGGEVTLTGFVEDRRQKRAAEDALEGVHGIREILNQIRVGRPGGSPTGGA